MQNLADVDISETDINNYIKLLYDAQDHEDRRLVAARGFIELFPFKRVHLYSYSILSESVEGFLELSDRGIFPLHINDNARNLSSVRTAFRTQKAVYSTGAEHMQYTPATYLEMDAYRDSVLIVPIFCNSAPIGHAAPFEYKGEEPIGESLLNKLTLYGKLIGSSIVSLKNDGSKKKLSNREMEVLQRAAVGETVKEMVDFMGISDSTIQDYMKSATKKLNAKNRVEAVAEALRQGIIM